MNYEEALKYIHSITWLGSRLGLERTFELLEKLGNPQKELKFIHIAGTNGKGSTAAMLASILEASGYRTGLYTSPFIHCFNERMQVNGEMIGNEELAELTEYIRPFAESMEDSPTEFELITALAFEFFKRRRCDIVVLEVGLGGELDSTNVIDTPEAAVITAIGLDHTNELGDTFAKIASAKAGIIKEDGDVILYGQNPEAEAVFEKVAGEKHSRLYHPDYSALTLTSHSLGGQIFGYETYADLHIPLLGTYQLNNAAVVLETVKVLQKKGWKITEKSLRDGLSTTRWRGRFELLSKEPVILVDGSHNPHGIRATAESLRTYFPEGGITFVVGVLADKDARTMMKEILPLAKEFITVTPPSSRAMKAEELAELLLDLGAKTATVGDSIEAACQLALERAGKDGVICALGSLYMVGDITRAFQR
ncbi:bifunctional folylpolyglutamate synthase/dihydrofolate synthase [Hominifimenecus sp. rT4P-3]|uniref:bifunctional folylpolyglutamate synthase/dihydrofolate synthase n=1 Tax=Hominifimenecus sp. rT4P-3 TaxID=3242979 RepID=UPI003DA30819